MGRDRCRLGSAHQDLSSNLRVGSMKLVRRRLSRSSARLITGLRKPWMTAISERNYESVAGRFLERHDARFAVPAADGQAAWRPWPDGGSSDAVFCIHYPRRISRDSTVSWPGGRLARPRRAVVGAGPGARSSSTSASMAACEVSKSRGSYPAQSGAGAMMRAASAGRKWPYHGRCPRIVRAMRFSRCRAERAPAHVTTAL